MKPLVTIIAISYNHGPFIKEALASVFAQTYEQVQLIILDDASKDDSVKQIALSIKGKGIKFIPHRKNQGYPKTFNEGLALAEGEYIIDFALDDVMKPGFVEQSIQHFERGSETLGVVFSNADYIDSEGKVIANHTQRLLDKKMIDRVPDGDVFEMVLRRYFVCTPTMVIRKEVFDRLGGYDESLSYEDFDFWVRSSRIWQYAYVDKVNFQKRKLHSSMSANRYNHHLNGMMDSVFKVCQKAFHLCKTKEELQALGERMNYEYRECLRYGAVELAASYRELMRQTGQNRSWKSFGFRMGKSMKMID